MRTTTLSALCGTEYCAHPIQRPAVLCAGVHGVDARGVDAAGPQQIGQPQQVLFRPVKGAGKQMAQIINEVLQM